MITTALLGLALAAAPAPVTDIAAQFGAETQATNISCSAYEATTYCYGVGADGLVVGATFADGVFTPIGAAAPAEGGGATTFGDGTWLVGADIAPGTYRSVVEDDFISLCSYSRLSGVSGSGDDLISWDVGGDAGAPVVVEILASDFAFESSGCGEWTPV